MNLLKKSNHSEMENGLNKGAFEKAIRVIQVFLDLPRYFDNLEKQNATAKEILQVYGLWFDRNSTTKVTLEEIDQLIDLLNKHCWLTTTTYKNDSNMYYSISPHVVSQVSRELCDV